MLKIGQNWGKIANYPPPPNAQQKLASLTVVFSYDNYSFTQLPSHRCRIMFGVLIPHSLKKS